MLRVLPGPLLSGALLEGVRGWVGESRGGWVGSAFFFGVLFPPAIPRGWFAFVGLGLWQIGNGHRRSTGVGFHFMCTLSEPQFNGHPRFSKTVNQVQPRTGNDDKGHAAFCWEVGTGQSQRQVRESEPDLPLASASSDMIRWSRVLLSHTLDAARSY